MNGKEFTEVQKNYYKLFRSDAEGEKMEKIFWLCLLLILVIFIITCVMCVRTYLKKKSQVTTNGENELEELKNALPTKQTEVCDMEIEEI